MHQQLTLQLRRHVAEHGGIARLADRAEVHVAGQDQDHEAADHDRRGDPDRLVLPDLAADQPQETVHARAPWMTATKRSATDGTPTSPRRSSSARSTSGTACACGRGPGAPRRLWRAGRGEVFGADRDLRVFLLHFVHRRVEHDAPAVDEQQVGQDVLDLLDLVGGDEDGALLVEVFVEQRLVELLAHQDVEAERRLVEHQQLRVDRHHEREVQLRDHALRQFLHAARLA